MADSYLKTLLTPAVREAQQHYYQRTYPDYQEAPDREPLGPQEKGFIESRDSFYLATITEDGWPYLQHRGGPVGFLRVLDNHRIGFSDYGGNRQLISVSSIGSDPRVSLFLMDYPHRQRLKILGHAQIHDARDQPSFADRLEPPTGHGARPERYITIEVKTYDWNCPKFITPRYTAEEWALLQ